MRADVTIVWSADELSLLALPGISRAAAAEMLGVHPVTIGRWVNSGKVSKLIGSSKICTSSLRKHVEDTVAGAIAKAVKFGGQA